LLALNKTLYSAESIETDKRAGITLSQPSLSNSLNYFMQDLSSAVSLPSIFYWTGAFFLLNRVNVIQLWTLLLCTFSNALENLTAVTTSLPSFYSICKSYFASWENSLCIALGNLVGGDYQTLFRSSSWWLLVSIRQHCFWLIKTCYTPEKETLTILLFERIKM